MVDERYISSSLLGLRQLSSEKTGDVVTFKLSSSLCNDYYASVHSSENIIITDDNNINNNNSNNSVNNINSSSINMTSNSCSSNNLEKMSSSISLLGGSKSDGGTKRIRRTGKYTPQEREITRYLILLLCFLSKCIHSILLFFYFISNVVFNLYHDYE